MCGPDFPAGCTHCGGIYYPEFKTVMHMYGCPRLGWAGQDSEFEKQRNKHLEDVETLNQHGRPE